MVFKKPYNLKEYSARKEFKNLIQCLTKRRWTVNSCLIIYRNELSETVMEFDSFPGIMLPTSFSIWIEDSIRNYFFKEYGIDYGFLKILVLDIIIDDLINNPINSDPAQPIN